MLGAAVELFRESIWGESSAPAMRVPSRAEAQDRVLAALLATPLEEKHRNPLEWLVSLIIHAVVIAALVGACQGPLVRCRDQGLVPGARSAERSCGQSCRSDDSYPVSLAGGGFDCASSY